MSSISCESQEFGALRSGARAQVIIADPLCGAQVVSLQWMMEHYMKQENCILGDEVGGRCSHQSLATLCETATDAGGDSNAWTCVPQCCQPMCAAAARLGPGQGLLSILHAAPLWIHAALLQPRTPQEELSVCRWAWARPRRALP